MAVASVTTQLCCNATPFNTRMQRSRLQAVSAVRCQACDKFAESQSHTRRSIAAAILGSPVLLVGGAAFAKDLKKAAAEKEARRKALKKKADDTKETGQSFEGEEFGKDYVPPESSSVSPAFFKSI